MDGWRIIADKDGNRVRLVSRHGIDHTKWFAGMAAAIAKLSARTLVIDGELAVFDQQLRSPLRLAAGSRPGRRRHMALDLLYRNGRDLTARPLRDRPARLEGIVAGSELVFALRRLAPDGLEAWRQVVERGDEGDVANYEASAYEGGRTRWWLKVKQKDSTVEGDGRRRRVPAR